MDNYYKRNERKKTTNYFHDLQISSDDSDREASDEETDKE